MPTKNTKFYSLILILADFVVLLAAFSVAYVARVQIDNRPLLPSVDVPPGFDYLFSVMTILPFWLIVFAFLGLYSAAVYNRRLLEWSRILVGSFVGILLMIGWEYVTEETLFPARLVVVYAFIGTFSLVLIERELVRAFRTIMFRFGKGISRVLVIGDSSAIADIASNLDRTKESGYDVVAVACPKRLMPADVNAVHYSYVEQALKNIKELGVTTIIQTDLYASEDRNQKILSAAQTNHIQYNFIPGEAGFYTGKNTVDVFLGYPMITVSQTPLIGWGEIAKRIFDSILSTMLIIILSPAFLLLFILQKTLNPGPIFYISKRLSRFSEPVDLIKFRSMKDRPTAYLDAAEEFRVMGREDLVREYEEHRKVAKDPRITRFGHFLRDTSLDELPQLFNVIRGDLSLVGPRPILPQEVRFDRGKAALLHSVRSGVTGLWQVSGRSNLDFDERIELELYYAQNWSFWLDIKILFKTIGVVIRKTGAK